MKDNEIRGMLVAFLADPAQKIDPMIAAFRSLAREDALEAPEQAIAGIAALTKDEIAEIRKTLDALPGKGEWEFDSSVTLVNKSDGLTVPVKGIKGFLLVVVPIVRRLLADRDLLAFLLAGTEERHAVDAFLRGKEIARTEERKAIADYLSHGWCLPNIVERVRNGEYLKAGKEPYDME